MNHSDALPSSLDTTMDDDDVPLLNDDDEEDLLSIDDHRRPTVEAVFVATFDVKYGRPERMSRWESDLHRPFR